MVIFYLENGTCFHTDASAYNPGYVKIKGIMNEITAYESFAGESESSSEVRVHDEGLRVFVADKDDPPPDNAENPMTRFFKIKNRLRSRSRSVVREL